MIHDHGIPESHIRAVFPKISYLVLPVLSTERTVIRSPQSKSNGLTNGNTSTDRKGITKTARTKCRDVLGTYQLKWLRVGKKLGRFCLMLLAPPCRLQDPTEESLRTTDLTYLLVSQRQKSRPRKTKHFIQNHITSCCWGGLVSWFPRFTFSHTRHLSISESTEVSLPQDFLPISGNKGRPAWVRAT